jgi:hypothetical protein
MTDQYRVLVKKNKWGNWANDNFVFVKVTEASDSYVCVGIQDVKAKVPILSNPMCTVLPLDAPAIKKLNELGVSSLDRVTLKSIRDLKLKESLGRLLVEEESPVMEPEDPEDFNEEIIKALKSQINTLKDEKHQLASAYHRVSTLYEKHEAVVAESAKKYETLINEGYAERRKWDELVDHERTLHQFKMKRVTKDYSAIVEELAKSQIESEDLKKELSMALSLLATKDKVLSDTLSEVQTEREVSEKLRGELTNSKLNKSNALSPEEAEFFGLIG